jgi:hypothetical protein
VLPPDATTRLLYAAPTVPAGSAMVVIARLLGVLEPPVLPLPVPVLPVLPQPARSAVAPTIRLHPSFPMV